MLASDGVGGFGGPGVGMDGWMDGKEKGKGRKKGTYTPDTEIHSHNLRVRFLEHHFLETGIVAHAEGIHHQIVCVLPLIHLPLSLNFFTLLGLFRKSLSGGGGSARFAGHLGKLDILGQTADPFAAVAELADAFHVPGAGVGRVEEVPDDVHFVVFGVVAVGEYCQRFILLIGFVWAAEKWGFCGIGIIQEKCRKNVHMNDNIGENGEGKLKKKG